MAAADDAGVAPPTGLSCSKAKPVRTRGGGLWCSPSAWCTPAVPGGSCQVPKPFLCLLMAPRHRVARPARSCWLHLARNLATSTSEGRWSGRRGRDSAISGLEASTARLRGAGRANKPRERAAPPTEECLSRVTKETGFGAAQGPQTAVTMSPIIRHHKSTDISGRFGFKKRFHINQCS